MATKPFIIKSNIGVGTSTVSAGSGLIVATGNVGIGTASPIQSLHLQGNSYINGHIAIGNTATVDKTNADSYGSALDQPFLNMVIQENVSGNLIAAGGQLQQSMALQTRVEYTHTGNNASAVYGPRIYGAQFRPIVSTNNTGNINALYGHINVPTVYGSGNVVGFSGIINQVYTYSSGETTNQYGTNTAVLNYGAGTVVNQYGHRVNTGTYSTGNVTVSRGILITTPLAGSTGRITGTNYGIYLEAQNTSAVSGDAYNIYSAGATAKNVFEGNVVARSLEPTGTTVPVNGIYLPATNRVSFATNTTERMTIDSSGQVGIGTSSPDARLDVFNGNIHIHSSTYGLVFSDGSFQTSAVSPGGSTGAVQYRTAAGAFGGDATNFYYDSTNYRLGIGTSGLTTATLNVWGSLPAWFNTTRTNDPAIIVGNSISTGTTLAQANDLSYSYVKHNATGSAIIAWNNTGVGINNLTSPKNALDVNGGAVIGGSIGYAGTATAPANGLLVAGSVGIGTTSASSALHVFPSTASTSTTTGAIITSGGVGIAGNLNVGGSTNYFAGNVGIGTTTPVYKLEVSGSFAATTKSFVIDHPTKPGKKLQYGSLESPYHGIRLTGEAELIRGKCTVKLPDYISSLCYQEGSQVQVTNIKHGKVLWIDDLDVNNNEFTVAASIAKTDKKTYKFYWSFTAIRKDIAPLEVEV